MKYVIQYKLPYEHQVQVGIEADSEEVAIARAEALFEAGDIWNDTAETPLLLDCFEETEESDLNFTVEQTLPVGADWPEADPSVKALRRKAAAFRAARLLIEACQGGGESLDRDRLMLAYAAACQALDTPTTKTEGDSA